MDDQKTEGKELLDLLCADPQIDTPQPEDIDNYGGNTDESNYIDDYRQPEKD